MSESGHNRGTGVWSCLLQHNSPAYYLLHLWGSPRSINIIILSTTSLLLIQKPQYHHDIYCIFGDTPRSINITILFTTSLGLSQKPQYHNFIYYIFGTFPEASISSFYLLHLGDSPEASISSCYLLNFGDSSRSVHIIML